MISPVEIELLAKVLFAALLGLLVGVERKGGPRGAGPRTFSLICMGSALFTVLSVVGFPGDSQTARVAAQIVTGVGFIGAGVIWREQQDVIHGITTAAAIWVSAAIGLAIGLGYIISSFVIAFVTMVVLSRGHPIREARKHITPE